MLLVKKSPEALYKAIAVLENGGVVVCPTDTVYGFLADAGNKKAVEKIYNIKKRPKSKPLSVFVKDMKMAKELAEISEKQEKYMKKYWPGKSTFILKRKTSSEVGPRIASQLYGVKKDTVALRIPNHAFLQKLLKKINRPLTQTSVNISTQESLNSAEQIIATFGKSKLVGLIIDGGDIKDAKPSKIVDLVAKKLTRLR